MTVLGINADRGKALGWSRGVEPARLGTLRELSRFDENLVHYT